MAFKRGAVGKETLAKYREMLARGASDEVIEIALEKSIDALRNRDQKEKRVEQLMEEKSQPEVNDDDQLISTHTIPFVLHTQVQCEVEIDLPAGITPNELKEAADQAIANILRTKEEVGDCIYLHAINDDIDPQVELLGGYA